MSNQNPKARRSQLLSTFGIGGLFPAENTSYMIRGLQDWGGDREGDAVSEPRLARSLGVRQLRLPPGGGKRDIPVVRFPETQVCPGCRRIAHIAEFKCGWNDAVCKICTVKNKGGLTPFRLLTCCARGHIDEFPYFWWLHQGQEKGSTEHKMTLEAVGATSSLADMRLRCTCGVEPTDLEGVFSSGALKGLVQCKGRRPWLGGHDHDQECSETPRTVQRGAANVWFPSVRSTISIPPFSEAVSKFVDQNWNILKNPEALKTEWAMAAVMTKARGKFTEAEVRAETERRHDAELAEDEPTEQSLRRDEFKALLQGKEESRGSDFVAEKVAPPTCLGMLLTDVRKVTRLREVRALYGFSRITPVQSPTDEKDRLCALTTEKATWLPAIQVIGEGVFLDFDRAALGTWAAQTWPAARAAKLQEASARAAQTYGREAPLPVDMVQVALHTIAHVLIDQLSLESGYPASSLRERLYVDSEMAGILLYTASSDSAGSLGGVAAHADTARLDHALREGLTRLSWCSNDPVCIESTGSGADGLNLAACHACVLVPETSCELNNTFLDRAALFGTPGDQLRGLFSAQLSSF